MNLTQSDLPHDLLVRLDALAAKLGTTTEYLWPMLVREQVVHGWLTTLVLSAVVVVALFLLSYMWRLGRRVLDVDEPTADHHFAAGMLCFLGIVVAAFGTVAALEAVDTVGLIVAPEGAALRSLLHG